MRWRELVFQALLLLIVVVNQLNAPLSVLPWRPEPDVALLVAVYGGLIYSPSGAAALGFSVGLLQETLAGGLIGVNALLKGLTGLVWVRLWSQVFGDGMLVQLPLLAMLTSVDGVVFFTASQLLSAPSATWDVLLPLLGRQLLSNLIAGPVLLKGFAMMDDKLTLRSRAHRRGHEPTATLSPK